MQIKVEVEIAAALPADISWYPYNSAAQQISPISCQDNRIEGGDINLISKFGLNLSGML